MPEMTFKFEKLEERIAPCALSSLLTGSCHRDGCHPPPPCHRGGGLSLELDLHVKAEAGCLPLKLPKCCH